MRHMRPLLVTLGLLLIWQLIVWMTGTPHFILPGPLRVLETLIDRFPLLMKHAGITLVEILLGMLLGTLLGLISALLLVTWTGLRRWLLPVLVASQAIPVFALAPVLMLWLGYGLASKVAMATLIIYFPVTATCFDGLRQTPTGYLQLARTLGADRRAQLLQIRLPAALPGLRLRPSGSRLGGAHRRRGRRMGRLLYRTGLSDAQRQRPHAGGPDVRGPADSRGHGAGALFFRQPDRAPAHPLAERIHIFDNPR